MKKLLQISDTNIKSKIVIIVIVIFAFFIITSLIFSIYSLESRGEKDIDDFRKSEKARTQEALKSFVHIAYTAVETNYKNATDVNYLSDYYGERLRNLLDIAEAVLKEKSDAVKKGRLTKAQAQSQAIEMIEKMRYAHGVGYYFIFTKELPFSRMVIEPTMPELNGKLLDDTRFNNASGSNKNIFVEAIKAIGDQKEGFIDYIWPRPSENNSESLDLAKFSYVRTFDEWNWVVGTGIYLDDAIKDCIKKSISDLRDMRYDNGTGYYWINDNTKPTPRLIMNPFIPTLEGQILTDKKYNRAFDEDYNLYEAFLDACEETGDGTVDYKWDKPVKGGIIEDAQKTSYVKFFKPLGWVIGSGVYIDDIDKTINSKIAKMEEQKSELIINYLLISLTLAAFSISVLVFLMNRYFRKSQNELDETPVADELEDKKTKDVIDNDTISAVSEAISKTHQQTPAGVNGNTDNYANEGSEISKVLEVVLREHTKQFAISKLSEKELKEKSEHEIEILTNEIRTLIQEVKTIRNA